MNGFEVASVKRRKPKLTRPSTPSTRAAKRAGRRAAPKATASVQQASRKIQRSSEPSCAPHKPPRDRRAVARSWNSRRRRRPRNHWPRTRLTRHPIAAATMTHWPATAGATAAIQRRAREPARRCRRTPAMPRAAARGSARTRPAPEALLLRGGLRSRARVGCCSAGADSPWRVSELLRADAGRPIVLIVLGEHLVRLTKMPSGRIGRARSRLRLTEEIGQYAGIDAPGSGA